VRPYEENGNREDRQRYAHQDGKGLCRGENCFWRNIDPRKVELRPDVQ
jgi:hypothetical protein